MSQARPPSDPPAPWGGLSVAPGETRAVRIGPRDLWAVHRDGEIWLGHTSSVTEGDPAGDATSTPPDVPPETLEWSRWATPGDEGELVLRPAFPDRAVVIEPERTFHLLPGTDARIYVRVPLSIRVELTPRNSQQGPVLLSESPSVTLSDTWWGGTMEGEPAYWLPTSARREIGPELFLPHLAICPLLLRNRSRSDLQVEKLAFRVVHLSLFTERGRLWGDETIVVYEDQPEGSRVEMTGRPPQEAGDGAQLVSGPRIRVERGFRARTFDALRAIPGVGGVW